MGICEETIQNAASRIFGVAQEMKNGEIHDWENWEQVLESLLYHTEIIRFYPAESEVYTV